WGGARRDIFDVGLCRTDPDAGREMRWLNLNELRNHLLACLDRVRATCVKATTRRWIDRRRHVALQHYTLPRSFYLRIGNGHRGNQRLRVRHQRLFVNRFRISDLNELAEIHYRYAI